MSGPGPRWSFSAEMFRWDEDGPSWRFIRVPRDVADEIREVSLQRRGFGSVRVTATVGETSWSTSVFPEQATKSFLLPVKKAVRDKEGLDDGDVVTVELLLPDLD
ncbi:MAG TPA: DUF1905 domain-containing protein [Aeromicrobium sp.]|nr:DUF1905 domain-containing protein [Aeromicrobium sp.]